MNITSIKGIEFKESISKGETIVKKYSCFCSYVYNPAIGDPEEGISSGTAFHDLPDGWQCPICGAGAEHFEVVED